MNKPEIIFIDLDGTTLDGPGVKFWERMPTEYTINVINKLQKQLPVVVSTGRGVNQKTQSIVSLLGNNSYIAWNGAKIVEDGKVIASFPVEQEVAQELFDDIKKNKYFVVFNSSKEHAFVKNNFYKFWMGFGKEQAKQYSEYKNDFEIFKALVWSISKSKIRKLALEWGQKYKGKLEVTLSGSNNILEITKINVSKGDAEVAYCKLKGIDPQNAIHFGDSGNDASTKNKVGKLIAMANSTDELKEIADQVLPLTCAESGLAKYLEENYLK